jgi:hypothetical protein
LEEKMTNVKLTARERYALEAAYQLDGDTAPDADGSTYVSRFWAKRAARLAK